MNTADDSSPLTRLQALADQCVMCGLCLPHCPTYLRDRVEAHGPRGRIALINAIAASREWLTAPAMADLAECLGCLRCQHACPAQVRYGALIDGARQLWLPPSRRARLWLWLVARPRALARLTAMGRRLRRWLPLRLVRGLEPVSVAATAQRRERFSRAPDALLLAGCSARSLEPGALAALLQVCGMTGLYLQVVDSGCCGALQRHAGQLQTAEALAKRHWSRLPPADPVVPLLGWASGCQQQLRETASVDRQTESVLSWFVREVAPRLAIVIDADERPGLWVPCTLVTQARGQGVLEQLLERVTAGRWQRVVAMGCCGAAGIRHLDAPAQSQPLTDAVLDEALRAGCNVLLSANPGCLHALRARAAERGLALRVLHVFEWLWRWVAAIPSSGPAGHLLPVGEGPGAD